MLHQTVSPHCLVNRPQLRRPKKAVASPQLRLPSIEWNLSRIE
eukprot:SAG31_NODE_17371_length_673_cov_1.170732_1_plen_42_part_01